WAWALACCGRNREAAHDVLHDVYVKILAGRARFDRLSSFKTWLFGVIRLTARNAQRKAAFVNLFFEPIPEHFTVAAPAAIEDEISEAFRAAVNALPQRQRQIAALIFEHDQTLEEAAAILRISIGAARQHYARAKEKLRAALMHVEAER